MITFQIFTHRAEINAMPCLPDEFQIEITRFERVMNKDIRLPYFEGYEPITREDMASKSIFIEYRKPKQEKLKQHSVQDILLDMYGHNWTYRDTMPRHYPKKKELS